ncbi:MAG: DMT family transporter, partial [Pseudomonadota bacterium]|nr:DMT family transporter [Pseudomonadota bacterium]
MSRLTANLILLLTAVIWGSAFVAQATAMAKMGPVLFTGLRFLLAALVVLPFALREGDGRLFVIRRDSSPGGGGQSWVGPVSALSAVFLAAQLLQQLGIMTTTVTNAGFLTAFYVILVPILGIALYRQWPHAVVWPAALIALGGTWLLGGGPEGLRGGDLLVMASA